MLKFITHVYGVIVIKNRIFAILRLMLLMLLSGFVSAQETESLPFGMRDEIYKSIPAFDLPAIDPAALRQLQLSSEKTKAQVIAYNFNTAFVPEKNGAWQTLSPNFRSWFLKLRSKGAYGMALVLSHIKLMPGEKLYVYNPDGRQGPFDEKKIPPSGILPLDFTKGDEIVIEYDVPANNTHAGTFTIEKVAHAYQDIFSMHASSANKSSQRNKNVLDQCYRCFEGTFIENDKRAVVRMIVESENGTKACTGTLMNNTSGDHTPYILTAQHCVANQADADRTIFTFGFEDEQCSLQLEGAKLNIGGSYHRASLFEHDFAILEMYAKPPLESRPYYAGWDISDQYTSYVTCIHHAQGGSKKVSISNGNVQSSSFDDGTTRSPNAFWNVAQWDIGVTEGGSSGAALFNKNHHVIGSLTGGSSDCSYPYNDFFEKLSGSWTPFPNPSLQLKKWLDPLGSGIKILDGTDPFEGINVSCETMTNVKPGELLELLPYSSGSGYFSGFNAATIASYAEKFFTANNAILTGAILDIGSVNRNSPGGLTVSVHTENNGLPGAILFDTYIPYDKLFADSLNQITFYPYTNVNGNFFISYTLSYSSQDSLALRQAYWRNNSDNTAYLKLSSGWAAMNTVSPGKMASSLGITATLCDEIPVVIPPKDTEITFYPNPATTVLLGKLPEDLTGSYSLQIYDVQGKLQGTNHHVYGDNIVISLTELNAGMYIIRFATTAKIYQRKFIKVY